MKIETIGEFIIHDTFKITGRGIVFAGRLTNGKIKTNAFLEFTFENKTIKRKIKGFDLGMRKNNPKSINHGIIIECKNEQEIKDFQEWKPKETKSKIIEYNTKSISEIRTFKKIRRRSRNKGTETLDFEFKYNPNVEVFYKRFFAKLIDFLVYYFLINLVIEYFNYSKDFTFFISLLSVFVANPIFESLFGRTIGKFIFGLQIIDDNCKYPNILKSYSRNLLQLFNFLFWFIFYLPPFDMYYHNEKTKTYTIYSRKKNEIKRLMENQNK